MNPALISAMNFMMSAFGKKRQPRELTDKEKQEVEKLNNMGLYSALKHLKK